MHMAALPACMSLHHIRAMPLNARRIRSPGTGATGAGEIACGCWELNLDPLEGRPVLLTTELTLQTCFVGPIDVPIRNPG